MINTIAPARAKLGGSGVAGNYTMYVNPFMVVNNMKFTKHYYMGSQRVVSKLGEMGAHQDMLNPREMKRAGGDTIEWDNKEMRQKEQLIANFLALGLDPLLFTAGKSGKIPYGRIKKYFRDGGTLPGGGNDDQNKPGKPETLQFFYHPDHLGSSSFITDLSGEVYQHIQYFPFGETFVEERTGTRYTPYLYNGKELDEETGLYYYGARYYDPRVSMFYGVDPLAEKHLYENPYSYAGNNPLLFLDPDGQEKIIAFDEEKRNDRILITASSKFQEQNERTEIHLFAHGNEQEIAFHTEEGKLIVSTPEQLLKYLHENSEIWNIPSGEKLTLVLQSCNTGKGEDSFAQKVSNHPGFNNVTVIAPNEFVSGSTKGIDGAYKKNIWGKVDLNQPGRWRIFEGGVEINSFSGGWKPKGEPTLWDRIWYK